MVGELAGPTSAQFGYPQVIDQEFGKLESALRQRAGARIPDWILSEQLQITVADHPGARPGGNDDRTAGALKDLDGMLRNGPRLLAQSGVEGRLSATGLSGWNLEPDTCALQDIHDCFPNFRIKRVDQAGNEELDGFSHWL